MFDDFEKLNFINMSDVALAKWLRENSYYEFGNYRSTMNLRRCLEVARVVKTAYKVGEIRGKVVK